MDAGHAGDQAAAVHDLLGVDAGFDAEEVGPRLQRHDDLLQRAVARPFAEAVDGALDLPRAGTHGRQRVGHGHTQVVVAVNADDGPVDVADLGHEHRDHLAVLRRDGVADGVRHVDRGGAGVDDGLDHLAEEVRLRAGSVFGAELDVGGVGQGALHALDRALEDFLAAHLQLVVAVDLAGGQEDVDAALRAAGDGLACAVYVRLDAARQTGYDGSLDDLADGLHALEVAGRGDGEAGLDDVHAQPFELLRDHDLLIQRHGAAGRLLAVPQCRVEYDDALCVLHLLISWSYGSWSCPPGSGRAGKRKSPATFRSRLQGLGLLTTRRTGRRPLGPRDVLKVPA